MVCHPLQEPLRLFALEPVDVVCLVANANAENGEGDNGDDGQHGAGAAGPTAAPPEGWAELEYTEAPEVEGFGKDPVSGETRGIYIENKKVRKQRLKLNKCLKSLFFFSVKDETTQK